jgi:hypothetical protein
LGEHRRFEADPKPDFACLELDPDPKGRAIAFSSEVDTGSREENASKQKIRASVLIQSEPKRL